MQAVAEWLDAAIGTAPDRMAADEKGCSGYRVGFESLPACFYYYIALITTK